MREAPIVAEIRRFRAEYGEKYGHDLRRICDALREFEATSGREVVCRGPRLLRPEVKNGPTLPDAIGGIDDPKGFQRRGSLERSHS